MIRPGLGANWLSGPLGASGKAAVSEPPSGMLTWLDFSDVTTLYQDTAKTSPITSDGQYIARIADKSGNGRDEQQTSGIGFCPVYKPSTYNGLSIARYDGNDLLLSVGIWTQNYPLDCTIIVVIGTTTVLTSKSVFTFGAGTQPAFQLNVSSGRPLLYLGNNNFRYFAANAAWNNGSPHIHTIVTTGAAQSDINNSEYYLDGISQGVISTVATGPATVANTFNIFGRNDRLTGDCGECLIYTPRLDAGNLALAHTYLMAKWGIS